MATCEILPPLLQDDDLVAEQERLVDVVGDEHDRLAELALQSEQLLLQLGADDRVDGAEWLVHQQDVRVDRESAGDADALLLAARELARVAIGEGPVEPDGVEQFEGVVVRLALAGAAEAAARWPRCRSPLRCGSRPEFCMT